MRNCEECGMPLAPKKGHGFVVGFRPQKSAGIVICGECADSKAPKRRRRDRG